MFIILSHWINVPKLGFMKPETYKVTTVTERNKDTDRGREKERDIHPVQATLTCALRKPPALPKQQEMGFLILNSEEKSLCFFLSVLHSPMSQFPSNPVATRAAAESASLKLLGKGTIHNDCRNSCQFPSDYSPAFQSLAQVWLWKRTPWGNILAAARGQKAVCVCREEGGSLRDLENTKEIIEPETVICKLVPKCLKKKKVQNNFRN